MRIAEHIVRAVKAGDGLTAIEFEATSLSWNALSQAIDTLRRLLDKADLGPETMVGLLGKNRLEQVSAFIAVLGADRGLLLVNALRPSSLIAKEVRELNLSCLISSKDDLQPEVEAASREAGTMLIAASVNDATISFRIISERGAGPFRPRQAETVIEIQTSGTTGAPKRIPIAQRTVEASMADGIRTARGAVERDLLVPKKSPTLMFGPLVHTSGTFNTLMSVFEVRPIVLFEKFQPASYLQAIRRYKPKFVALPPTALKMLLDSDATREDFASVIAVRAGTAPLAVALQVAFEERFETPVLVTYGATEFMGAVTSWTLEDHRRFAMSKRGSVGRVSKGVQLRVVDPQSGQELPCGEEGVLEARLERLDGGEKWLRTTDIARLDADGFLYIVGRADDAIIRGGFKIMAGKVADALRQYPGVYDVIVLGRPDERLGEVPVALVELYPDAPWTQEQALREFAKQRLTSYEVPVRFYIVQRLPRTVSDKISRPETKRLLDSLEASPRATGP